MKKILLLATSALLLLAGCAKEVSGPNGEGGLQKVTFTANLAGEATKAVADNDGEAASVNRCIMEIYYGDDLFTRMYSAVTNKTASFTTQLVSNRTYTVAFWADCVTDASSAEGLATDLYYTTTSLKAVAIKGDYIGNNDARDAFFHCDSYTVAQTGSIWSDVKLYRPFSQINVITTDLQTIKPVPALVPTGVDVTVKNAYTTFNVVDGTLGGAQTLNYAASLYNFPETIGEKTEATLSMDYLFAASDKAVIDIDWKATKANNADVIHSFSNIPYQRNYRTNIKGALLTTQGQWNVTVEPTWNVDQTGEFDVIVLIANTISEAQTLINAHAGENSVDNTVEIQVKESVTDEQKLWIPDNTDTPNWVFKIENMTSTGKIIVEDENPLNDDVNYRYSAEVALPSGTSAAQATFNTPNAHGVVSGTFGRVDATTSSTTLEVRANATIGELYVNKGNVALYGTVGSIKKGSDQAPDFTVNIYDSAVWTNWATEKVSTGITPIVNLGTYTFDPTGYNVAGSSVTANGGSPATWTVSISNEWKNYAAESFSNVSGTTITIMNAAELALFAKNVNANVDYTGYTFNLGADIDLSGHNWNPIMFIYNGSNIVIDGAGRTISGLQISSTESNLGLFGEFFSQNTVIKNITIKNPSVTQTEALDYTAALCAHIGCGTVDNCSVIGGTVTGRDQVGAIVGCIGCGTVKNCTVDGTTVSAAVCRAGGIAGKGYCDNYYVITNNTVRNATIIAAEKYENMLSAGAVTGQVMTGTGDVYTITNNCIENVTTKTGDDNTFVPIGEFRDGSAFKADASTAGHIINNTWDAACADTDYYNMVNPANTSEYAIIWNGSTPDPVAKIGETEYFTLDAALKAGIANNDGVPVEIIKDITYKPSATWTPVPIGFYLDTRTLVVDGGNHTITNLPEMMFDGDAGCFNLTIRDLTFEKPTATDDSNAAVICGDCATSGSLTFSNVKIDSANVTSGDYAGAFVGYNATHGDGGAVTFTNCYVTNSTITGVGSTGALMGHATGNSMGKVTVTGTTVTGNTISCTKSGKTDKAGSLFGTVGFATENVYVSATVSGNTVTSDGTTITTIYGRKGTNGGNLYLTEGGSYADKPIADADASWAMCDDGCVLKQVDNVWTVLEVKPFTVDGKAYSDIYAAISAVASATDKTVKIVEAGTYEVGEGYQSPGCDYTIESTLEKVSDVTIHSSTGWTDSGHPTLKDLTFKCNDSDIDDFLVGLNFDGCTLIGRFNCAYANDLTFNGCTFDCTAKYQYAFWTAGTVPTINVINCIFNTQGKAIKMYGTGTHTLKVEGCTFNDSNSGSKGKPAIAINTNYWGYDNTDYTVYIKECTANGFSTNLTGDALYGSDVASEIIGNLDVLKYDKSTSEYVYVWKDGAKYPPAE